MTKLKAAGHPCAQTAGDTFGDAPGWWYPYLWSWGGKEVAEDGKRLRSKEKRRSSPSSSPCRCGKGRSTKAGFVWDDSTNNAPSCGVASAPVLEEIADQPTGACAYHNRVRLGQGLQVGGEGMLFREARA
jgi:hypothetical protein